MQTTRSTACIQIFTLLSIPLACWQLWLFPGIPNYHLQHAFIYPAGAYFLWLVYTERIDLRAVLQRVCTVVPLMGLVLCLQAIALWQYSFLGEYLTEQVAIDVRIRHLLTSLLKLVVQWPFLVIFVELCRFTWQCPQRRRLLLYSFGTASILLLLLCSLQCVYIYTLAVHSPVLQGIHELSGHIISSISPSIEARWGKDAVYDFYANGAYSLTIHRVNGVFEEASSLAAWVGTFFLPLTLGWIAVRGKNAKALVVWGWTLSIAWILMLFLIRSSTALLIALSALALLLVWSVRAQKKALAVGASTACLGIGIMIILYTPGVATYLQHRVSSPDALRSPRAVIMLDTIEMIKKHPWTGVGRGNFSIHIVRGARYQAQEAHDPELRAWKKNGVVPFLSGLLGFTAQYGIPLTLLLLGGILRVWRRLYLRWRGTPDNRVLQYAFAACTAWCALALITSIGSVDFRNPLFLLPLFSFMCLSQEDTFVCGEASHAG